MADKTDAAKSAGAYAVDPWAATAMFGGDIIMGMSQPDPPEQMPGNLVATSPTQFQMYDDMVRAYMSGSGDYGYGANLRPGVDQMQQYMADRGVSADSGVGYSAMADLISNATAADAANRQSYGMQLLNSPPQTAVITGQNQIPGASDMGMGGRNPDLEQLAKSVEFARSIGMDMDQGTIDLLRRNGYSV